MQCFYCERRLPAAAAVDHFIPWSRFPRDLAHNLVPAHGARNSRKNDLPGGTEAGLLVDRATSVAVAEWSYGHAERVQAEVWLGTPRLSASGDAPNVCNLLVTDRAN